MAGSTRFLPGGDHFPEWTLGSSPELLLWPGGPAKAGAGSPPGSESVNQGAGCSSWTHKPSAGCPCSRRCSLLPPSGKKTGNPSGNVSYDLQKISDTKPSIFLRLNWRSYIFLCGSTIERKTEKAHWSGPQHNTNISTSPWGIRDLLKSQLAHVNPFSPCWREHIIFSWYYKLLNTVYKSLFI